MQRSQVEQHLLLISKKSENAIKSNESIFGNNPDKLGICFALNHCNIYFCQIRNFNDSSLNNYLFILKVNVV